MLTWWQRLRLALTPDQIVHMHDQGERCTIFCESTRDRLQTRFLAENYRHLYHCDADIAA